MDKRRTLRVATVLLLLGPLAGLVAYRVERSVDRARVLDGFRKDFQERVFALEKELAGHIDAVGTVKALFDSGEQVTREEFRGFAGYLLERHRGIKALEWIPRVPGDERARHEADTRASGLERYRITELLDSEDVVPAAERAEYYPVHFVEPVQGNEPALGFDLGSDECRRNALARASETGEPTLTDPLRLVQETGSSTGLLLLFPVYRGAEVSEPSRRPALRGFALGVIRVDELMKQSLPVGGDPHPLGMVLELVDDDTDGEPTVMYSGPDPRQDDLAATASRSEAIEVAGQQWHLIGRPRQDYLARQSSAKPIAFGIATVLGWESLVVLGITLVNRSRHATERRQARFIRSVLDSLSEGVIVADSNGAFRYVNRAARRMVKVQPGPVPPNQWSEAFGLYVPGTETLFPADELPLARAVRGEGVESMEVYVRNPRVPQGAWVSVNGVPLIDGDGSLQGGIVVFRDITGRKKAEELSRRLSNAVEETADGVFITDREGVIEYVNAAFETITGYSSAEALGRTPRILKSGKQHAEYYSNLWQVLLRGEPFKGSVVNRRRNGELFHAQQTITPLRDSRSSRVTHFVSVLRDTTEQVRIEEQAMEMRLAAKVQRQTFPQEAPRVPGFDIAGTVSPALQTCGDYYDFIPLPDGKLGIAIADACGHGLGPALIMAGTRVLLRTLVQTYRNPAQVLTEVNKLLARDLSKGHYVTMILARLDPQTGKLQWANAGHPPGFVLDTSGSVKVELTSTGVPLGLFPDRSYASEGSVVLEPGESALFLTDGVTETRSPDGHDLSAETVVDLVRTNRHTPAQEILARLHRFASEFAGGQPQKDDLTSVLCKRRPESESNGFPYPAERLGVTI